MARKISKKQGQKYIVMILIVLLALIAGCVIIKSKDLENRAETEDIEIDSEMTDEENANSEDPILDVELPQQTDAEYEKWLAATMVVAISMEYPEFEDIQIYTETSTTLENRSESKGVYVLFKESGKPMAIHSKAIPDERDEKGTKDISSQVLGFATFDQTDAGEIKSDKMTEIGLAELEELIKQSMLVSIYSR